MKRNKGFAWKILSITAITALVTISNALIVFAEKATTFSVWPSWFGEPELPQELLDNIH